MLLEEVVDVTFFALNPGFNLENKIFNSYSKSSSTLTANLKTSQEYLLKLYEKYNNNKSDYSGILNIYYYNDAPHGILFAFDLDYSYNSAVFYVPYFYKISSRELPGYLITDKILIEQYRTALLKLERNSIPLSVVIPDVIVKNKLDHL